MMWPFKWKLSACTFTWCCLFVKILENEMWKFGRNLPLATFGSERVNSLRAGSLVLVRGKCWRWNSHDARKTESLLVSRGRTPLGENERQWRKKQTRTQAHTTFSYAETTRTIDNFTKFADVIFQEKLRFMTCVKCVNGKYDWLAIYLVRIPRTVGQKLANRIT